MFVDIHHHFVYGVDDGARSFEATKRLLRASYADGVREVIATPHVTPGEIRFPREVFLGRLEHAQVWCAAQGMDLRLRAGAEILYTDAAPRLLREGEVQTLAGSRFALLEFLPDDSEARLREAARRVGAQGFVPVFAHVERYRCLKRARQFEALRAHLGVRMQVNAATVVSGAGLLRGRLIMSLIRDGLIDYVASDSHDLAGRQTCMTRCYTRLAERFGEGTARALTRENQMEILRGAKENRGGGEK